MRVKLFFFALAFASFAHAQTVVTGPEAMVREAYENQRQNSDLVLEMRGTDTRAGSTATIHAVLYWRLSADPRTNQSSRAQVELDVSDVNAKGEDVLRMRIVGDGTSLYRYDVARREVSTSLYGFYGTTPPAGYAGSDAPKLLAQLRSATPGLSAYLVRLLEEMNPAGSGYADRYADWMPGRRKMTFDEVPMPPRRTTGNSLFDTVTDPITGRAFMRNADEWMFVGMDSLGTDRTVAFRMVDENAHAEGTYPRWVVGSLNVAQRAPNRVVDLTLVPNSGTAPAWAYSPYTGAQAAAFRPIAARL